MASQILNNDFYDCMVFVTIYWYNVLLVFGHPGDRCHCIDNLQEAQEEEKSQEEDA